MAITERMLGLPTGGLGMRVSDYLPTPLPAVVADPQVEAYWDYLSDARALRRAQRARVEFMSRAEVDAYPRERLNKQHKETR